MFTRLRRYTLHVALVVANDAFLSRGIGQKKLITCLYALWPSSHDPHSA